MKKTADNDDHSFLDQEYTSEKITPASKIPLKFNNAAHVQKVASNDLFAVPEILALLWEQNQKLEKELKELKDSIEKDHK